MKKFLTIILSALCLLVGVCFAGCDNPQGQDQVIAKTYYGVVQTIEEQEGLLVYIPEVGVCDLPSYKDGEQQDITVKEGDLIRMDFDGAEVEFMERYPVGIKTPVKNISVQMENVELEQAENEYILTIDYTEKMENEFLAYEKAVGDTVYFTGPKGMAGTDGMVVIHEYCTATIENDAPKRLTLRLHLGDYTIQEFLKAFATRRIGISPVSDSLNAQPLKNFFDIKDELEESDIQKIETVEYGGSTAPDIRQPVEYKTSTLAADIKTVYTWLMSLNNKTLTRVTEEETQVEGGGAVYLTVYTRLGTFKICEFGLGHLNIWNGYFEQEGKMPDIVGETVTYAFESYSDEAGIYMGIIDDGIKVGSVNFDFGGMVCKLSDKTFTDEVFRLVADIGELNVYDGTHFKRNGIVYEIISETNFSKIIADYFSGLENRTLLIETYEAKYPNAGKAHVLDYYGEYESGAIVAMMAGSEEGVTTALWTETVGKFNIPYNDGNRISVLYENEFYTLTEAYENGYLTDNDMILILAKHRKFYPFLFEYDSTPPVVWAEEAERFIEAYETKYPNAGKATISFFLGVTESGAIVAKIAGENEVFTQALWTETVAGYEIKYNNGNRISVLYENEFYTLTEAYENGYLTKQDIENITIIYSYFKSMQFKVTVVDPYNRFFDKPTQEYFMPGTTITLRCYPIMDADLVMYINGERYGIQTTVRGDDGEYVWEYSFIMPAADVTITFQTSGGM